MIKDILCKSVERKIPTQDVAVLLSGGVDSLSVAFAASDVGKTVHAYSFHLDTGVSYDFQKAKDVAEHFGWNFTGVSIPTDNLKQDFYRLVELDCRKKTHFECVYPFLYLYPKIKQKYVLSGWAADGYYGISKKAILNYKHTQELFDMFRDDYFKPENTAGYNWHKKVADKYNKNFITPYLTPEVREFFYSKSWEQLNLPHQKHHVRAAFEQFNHIGNVKNHLNLQIGCGIVDLFETLIDDKEINFRNRTRIMDICKDWWTLNNTNTLEDFFV